MSFPKQSEIELPLLKALHELGGKAEPKELYPKLATALITLDRAAEFIYLRPRHGVLTPSFGLERGTYGHYPLPKQAVTVNATVRTTFSYLKLLVTQGAKEGDTELLELCRSKVLKLGRNPCFDLCFVLIHQVLQGCLLPPSKKGAISLLLLDGEAIAESMIRNGIGVVRRPVQLFDLDPEFFRFPAATDFL